MGPWEGVHCIMIPYRNENAGPYLVENAGPYMVENAGPYMG